MSRYRSRIAKNLQYTRDVISLWQQHLPFIKPFYAIKANPDPDIINVCLDAGTGFDYASKGELLLFLEAGQKKALPGDQLDAIFANPTKSATDVISSRDAGYHRQVVDSIEEVRKLRGLDPEASVVVRVISNEMYSALRFNSKFGVGVGEFERILECIVGNDLRFEGISYHVGSKCSNMMAHTETLREIVDSYFPVCAGAGTMPELIDIGGGFENVAQVLELASEIKPVLQSLEGVGAKLIAEPGRLLASGVYDVYVDIVAVRERDGVVQVTVNDSIYHTFQGRIYDGQVFTPIPQYDGGGAVLCTVFGQTCDSLDVISDGVMLPQPKVGDTLLQPGMGAYSTASAGGRFNGFETAV